jgi:anti-sigma-K factor RskA
MTGPGRNHHPFDELAMGYVLHVLAADEERRFVSHAEGCPRCQQALADYGEVAAALADITPAAEPSPQLEERIQAMARGDLDKTGHPAHRPAGPGDAQPGSTRIPGIMPLRRGAGRGWLRAAAVVAAAAAVGGGVWGGLAATSSGPQPPRPACVHERGCAEVLLTAAGTHQQVARVIISGGSAWLVPARLRPDDPADQIYVLWQITGARAPMAVGSFDIRPGSHAAIKIGALPKPYPGTRAFAISLEHGRAIPASPSRPVALGRVS